MKTGTLGENNLDVLHFDAKMMHPGYRIMI